MGVSFSNFKASSSTVTPGAAVNFNGTITTQNSLQNVIVQVKILKKDDWSANTKVAETVFKSETFTAGQARNFSGSIALPSQLEARDYVIYVSLYNANWSHVASSQVYAGFTVAASKVATTTIATAETVQSKSVIPTSTSASANFVFENAKVDKSTMAPGGVVSASATIRSSTAAENTIVQFKILKKNDWSATTKIAEAVLQAQNFASGVAKTYNVTMTLPIDAPQSDYVLYLSVYNSSWGHLASSDTFNAFSIGAASVSSANSTSTATSSASTPTPVTSTGLTPVGAPMGKFRWPYLSRRVEWL